VLTREGEIPFQRIASLIKELFPTAEGIVLIGPCGVAIRAMAHHIHSKHTDPPVVVVDAGGRYAISLIGGHEGGANNLAFTVGNIIGAEPVITTTTDAVKAYIIGIGCRKGVNADAIIEAVHFSLQKAGVSLEHVRVLSTADIKKQEEGLIEAAHSLGVPIRFIPSDEIRACTKNFCISRIARKQVNLPAVAEPAALLAGRRTSLIQGKTIHRGVTVAIARENSI
jgi:cobalt-precorrin 5A hydrolase